ncbi:MAG: dephospho-CoA kinase [Coriobacteriia bacterium]|nr:dephospho-CoA kinase [Coriobacteriia bacterium]
MIDRPRKANPTPAPVQASVRDTAASSAVPQMTLFICGPFGAGKSTVTRFVTDELTGRGHEVCTIILDTIGHELLDSDEKLCDILVKSFGEQILDKAGHIDRRALATAGFADAASRTALNAITHPVILTRAVAQLAEYATADFCVFEAPFPFSTLERTPGYGSEYLRAAHEHGAVVTVSAPRKLRMQRVRDKGFSISDAQARMAAQPEEGAYLAGADYCLDNVDDLAALHQSVSDLVDTLCR